MSARLEAFIKTSKNSLPYWQGTRASRKKKTRKDSYLILTKCIEVCGWQGLALLDHKSWQFGWFSCWCWRWHFENAFGDMLMQNMFLKQHKWKNTFKHSRCWDLRADNRTWHVEQLGIVLHYTQECSTIERLVECCSWKNHWWGIVLTWKLPCSMLGT